MFTKTNLVLLIFWLFFPVGLTKANSAFPSASPTPSPVTQWESQMITKGTTACAYINQPGRTNDEYLAATYYDGERVFYQIATYTGNTATWNPCAARAEQIYRAYVTTNNGQVPGFWNFTEGFLLDFQRTGDVDSKNAALLLTTNAAFSGDSTPLAWTAGAEMQREVAYAVMGYVNEDRLTGNRRARLADLVNQALDHINQLFISKTYRCPDAQFCPPEAVGEYHIKPFMSALEMQALIKYYDLTGDTRIYPAVKVVVDWLWANAWISGSSSFWYENWTPTPSIPFPSQLGAPDLNLLIAPAFAWIYKVSGDVSYITKGDQVFRGGVVGAFLDNNKQFNQNYMWSFDYVAWRNGPVGPYTTVCNWNTTPACH